MHVNSTLSYPEKPDKEKVKNIISDLLSASGFAEIMCNSLCPSAWYEQSDDFNKDSAGYSGQSAQLRPQCYEAITDVRRPQLHNLEYKQADSDLKLYEFGNCYFYNKKDQPHPTADNYTEKSSLDLFISGNTGRQSWNCKNQPF